MSDQAKGLLITFFGVLFVVPDAVFVRLIDTSALTVAFWRSTLVGGTITLGLLIWQGTAPFKAVAGTGINGVIYVLALGSSGILFLVAVGLTSIANVVFIIASLPVFAALYSKVFLAEPISQRMYLTIAAVLPGLAIIAYGSGETEGASLAGDLLALAASATFAAGLTAARRARATSMVPALGIGYLLAGCVIYPWVDPFSVPAAQMPLVGLHASVIVVSSVLLALGPRYITSAEVGLLVLLESVCSPLLAWWVVGENPGNYALLGGAIVIGALFISNLVALTRRKALGNAQGRSGA